MDCIFCQIIAGTIPSYQVYADEHAVAFLDISPSCHGHTLVVPRRHAVEIDDITPDDLALTARTTQAVAHILRSRLHADGLNVQQNNGPAAGQLVFHYHVHLLPRWANDGGISLHRRGETNHTELAELAAALRS